VLVFDGVIVDLPSTGPPVILPMTKTQLELWKTVLFQGVHRVGTPSRLRPNRGKRVPKFLTISQARPTNGGFWLKFAFGKQAGRRG